MFAQRYAKKVEKNYYVINEYPTCPWAHEIYNELIISIFQIEKKCTKEDHRINLKNTCIWLSSCFLAKFLPCKTVECYAWSVKRKSLFNPAELPFECGAEIKMVFLPQITVERLYPNQSSLILNAQGSSSGSEKGS